MNLCPPAPQKMGKYAYAASNDYEHVRVKFVNAPEQFAATFWNEDVKPEELSGNLRRAGKERWEGFVSFVDRNGSTSAAIRKSVADTFGRGYAHLGRSDGKLFTIYNFEW